MNMGINIMKMRHIWGDDPLEEILGDRNCLCDY